MFLRFLPNFLLLLPLTLGFTAYVTTQHTVAITAEFTEIKSEVIIDTSYGSSSRRAIDSIPVVLENPAPESKI